MKLSNLLLLLVLLGLASGCTAFELEGYTVNRALSLSGQRLSGGARQSGGRRAQRKHPSRVFACRQRLRKRSEHRPVRSEDGLESDGIFPAVSLGPGEAQPRVSWTRTIPVTDPIQLTALHYACQWAVRGGPEPGLPYEMLRGSRDDDVLPDPTHPNPYALWPDLRTSRPCALRDTPESLGIMVAGRTSIGGPATRRNACDTYVWVKP